MGLEQILLIVGVIILGWIVIKAAKMILKVGAILLLVAAFFFWYKMIPDSGLDVFFKKAEKLSDLQRLCAESEGLKEVKCDCIVEPIYNDMSQRLTGERLTEVEANPELFKKELRKSLQNSRHEIKDCIAKEKGPEMADKIEKAIDGVQDFGENVKSIIDMFSDSKE
ncbi:hypothetical protein V6R21_21670 [Limibacter armeniacum]|uniref:hypothetical protein n=1 Tax=Limibacter armeniacum TaxID=466084 RepID=UPI002FE63CC4